MRTWRVLHQQLNTPAWKWHVLFPVTTLLRNIHMVLTFHERAHKVDSQKYLAKSHTDSQGRRKRASVALNDLQQERSRRLAFPEENVSSPGIHWEAQWGAQTPSAQSVSAISSGYHHANNERAQPTFIPPRQMRSHTATEKAL